MKYKGKISENVIQQRKNNHLFITEQLKVST